MVQPCTAARRYVWPTNKLLYHTKVNCHISTGWLYWHGGRGGGGGGGPNNRSHFQWRSRSHSLAWRSSSA